MHRHLPVRATAVVIALTAILAGCGSDHSSMDHGSGSASTTAGTANAAGSLNAADIEFAQGMIAHHEQAIEMSEIALDPKSGAGPEVVDLATRIQSAQEPEVTLMTGWLTAADQPLTMDEAGHDMSSMPGMMTADQMDALAALTGPAFDQMWLEMMIAHHEGAIAQSEDVEQAGSNAEVRALAEQIITTQQGEIPEMQALLTGG